MVYFFLYFSNSCCEWQTWRNIYSMFNYGKSLEQEGDLPRSFLERWGLVIMKNEQIKSPLFAEKI